MKVSLNLVFCLVVSSLLWTWGCVGDAGSSNGKDLIEDQAIDQEIEDLQEDQDWVEQDEVDEPQDLDQELDQGDTNHEEDLAPLCEEDCGANGQCVAGQCECLEGFANCDADLSNGCEADLNATQTCGACETNCGANAECNAGICSCAEGFDDCDGDWENGCEADLSSDETCGACDNLCGENSSCAAGSCECSAGYGDCDGDLSNGCEARLNTPEHCGTCEPGRGCLAPGTDKTCVVVVDGELGDCELSCAANHYDLDGDIADTATAENGCELYLEKMGEYGLRGQFGQVRSFLDAGVNEDYLFAFSGASELLAFDIETMVEVDSYQYGGWVPDAALAVKGNKIAVLFEGGPGEYYLDFFNFNGSELEHIKQLGLGGEGKDIKAIPSGGGTFVVLEGEEIRGYSLRIPLPTAPLPPGCTLDDDWCVTETDDWQGPDDASELFVQDLPNYYEFYVEAGAGEDTQAAVYDADTVYPLDDLAVELPTHTHSLDGSTDRVYALNQQELLVIDYDFSGIPDTVTRDYQSLGSIDYTAEPSNMGVLLPAELEAQEPLFAYAFNDELGFFNSLGQGLILESLLDEALILEFFVVDDLLYAFTNRGIAIYHYGPPQAQ